MRITKVYTRRGDTGQTDLVGGVRVKKSDVRLEAYGTIDELNAHLGLLVAMLPVDNPDRAHLLGIQNTLFHVGTHLATDQSQTPLYAAAQLPQGATQTLEQIIDAINEALPPLRGFILPGGCPVAAQAHVARTLCRRAERCIDALAEQAEVAVEVLQYVNRLSDYLFVLARKLNVDAGQSEQLWENACK